MKVKNVWHATWFSFVVGFVLVALIFICLLFNTSEFIGSDDFFIGLLIAGIMGAIYFVIQCIFSFLMDVLLRNKDLMPIQVLLITLKTMLFLYLIVFFYQLGYKRFLYTE